MSDLGKLVADRAVVRIWDGPHSSIRAEGRVVGIIEAPTIIVEDADGVHHYESSNLPRDLMVWAPQNYPGVSG
jgi:hypothetical protein